ncbi:MAG: hypothetical protein H7318_00370 [Oligoflexus sp.]|nr:hypothetical protein [Oligoflexus sp.]
MGRFNSLLLSLGLLGAACSPSHIKTSNSETKIVDESLSSVDLLKSGSFAVSEYEYDSGGLNDPDVLSSNTFSRVKTDVRGRIFLPAGEGPFPLVVLLHGNHSTCGFSTGDGNPRLDVSVEYSTTGSCPSGYVEVPSYRGYDASARLLASWGLAVASVNANRGITGRDGSDSFDGGLVYARGNLVLRHIEELAKWSREGESALLKADGLDLAGKLDISKVGLMGHSRGGEGVRYAYNIYTSGTSATKWQTRIPGLKIQGIFEIGPVDMGTNNGKNKVEARGVAWNVLIPGCDRDVSDFSGINPFERMELTADDGFPKSIFTLWGANHNFFNSEWQVSDAPHTCIGEQKPLWNVNASAMTSEFQDIDSNAREGLVGSDTQIKFEKALMLAFFHSHLGSDKDLKWDHIFDPQYRLPTQLSTLAFSSREFVGGSVSKAVFNPALITTAAVTAEGVTVKSLEAHVTEQIKLMGAGLDSFSEREDADLYSPILSSGSFIRSAAVIEGKSSSAPKSVFLPFDRLEATQDYWTLDVALAIRAGCYTIKHIFKTECAASVLDDSFDVSLVLEDGTVTPSVNIQDYIKLDNWYDNFFQLSGSWPTSSGRTGLYFQYVPVLYQTARFELTDFGVTTQEIKGVQISFKSGADVSLILESMRLSKRP